MLLSSSDSELESVYPASFFLSCSCRNGLSKKNSFNGSWAYFNLPPMKIMLYIDVEVAAAIDRKRFRIKKAIVP